MNRLQFLYVLIFALAGVIHAEERNRGFFAGVQFGAGSITFDTSANIATSTSQTPSSNNYSDMSIGLVAGYKHTLKSNIALRYYGQLNYITGINNFDDFTDTNIGLNTDVIYRFTTLDVEELGAIEIGGFLGLGLESTNYKGTFPQNTQSGYKIDTTGFDVVVHLGAMGVVNKRHGFELFLRLPFVAHTLLNGNANDYVLMKAKEKYNFNFRYVFYF